MNYLSFHVVRLILCRDKLKDGVIANKDIVFPLSYVLTRFTIFQFPSLFFYLFLCPSLSLILSLPLSSPPSPPKRTPLTAPPQGPGRDRGAGHQPVGRAAAARGHREGALLRRPHRHPGRRHRWTCAERAMILSVPIHYVPYLINYIITYLFIHKLTIKLSLSAPAL